MSEKIEQACFEAKEKMIALGIDDQLVSELEWCLGSYAADKNPAGLMEKGAKALEALKAYREKSPRKISKKIVDDLEKALK